MVKQGNFSLTGSSLKVLISLMAALCLSVGMLISPFLVYADSADADSLIIVQFNDFGDSQSATALFNGQPIDSVNQCLPADGQPSLAGNVPESEQFLVNFYSTSDCTQTDPNAQPTQTFSFTAPPGGGTVTCNSDTDCQLVPNTNQNSVSGNTGSLVIVQFNSLGGSQSATAHFNGQPIDNVNQCLTVDGTSLAGNVPPSANFTVDFYSSQDCTGDTTNSIQFTTPDGGGKVTITCDSDQECSSDQ